MALFVPLLRPGPRPSRNPRQSLGLPVSTRALAPVNAPLPSRALRRLKPAATDGRASDAGGRPPRSSRSAGQSLRLPASRRADRTAVPATGTDVRLRYLVQIGNLKAPYEDLSYNITISSRRARRKGKATERWRRKATGSTAGPPSQDSQLPKRDGHRRSKRPSCPWKGWLRRPPRALC